MWNSYKGIPQEIGKATESTKLLLITKKNRISRAFTPPFLLKRLIVGLHILTHQIAEWPGLHSKAAPRSYGPCVSGFWLACPPAGKYQSWPPRRWWPPTGKEKKKVYLAEILWNNVYKSTDTACFICKILFIWLVYLTFSPLMKRSFSLMLIWSMVRPCSARDS